MRTALLLGATGLVGRHTLARLARDPRWSRVVTLDRRPLAPASPTHTPRVVDFDRLDEVDPRRLGGRRRLLRHRDDDQAGRLAGRLSPRRPRHPRARRAAHARSRRGADAARHVDGRGRGQPHLLQPHEGTGRGGRARRRLRVGPPAAAVSAHGRPRRRARGRARRRGRSGRARVRSSSGRSAHLRPTPADDVAAALVAFAAARTPGVHVHDAEAIRATAARTADPAADPAAA